jgi:diguanylate cyclase (GGDEF)-like protein
MADRVLVVEERRPIAAALRAHLELAGFVADVVAEGGAVAAAGPDHAFAIVRAARRDLEKALRERDPALLVVLLFDDDDAALAAAQDPTADAILVGPLFGPVVTATARAMVRLRAEGRRAAAATDAPERTKLGADDLAFFRRILLMEVKRARRYRYPLAIAALSLDRWSEFGPDLGAEGRARLLGEVLGELARGVREVDLPLLHTGERFLVVMPHTDADGALLVARRLCERIRALESAVPLSASCGVASFGGEGPISLASMLAEAGSGIEAARRAGGGTAERGTPARRGTSSTGGAEA